MEPLSLLTQFLAAIGFLVILFYILIPIIKTFIFGIGYTLIMILNFDLKFVIKRPIAVIRAILKRFYLGISQYLIGPLTITKCQYGSYTYEPMFKISKYK
jgi:hypothetical protein